MSVTFWLAFFKCWQSFSISAGQFVERSVLVVLVRPRCPRTIIWYKIWWCQGLAWNSKCPNFHELLALVAPHVRKNDQVPLLTRVSMFCGAALVISNCIWLVETVLCLPARNTILGRGLETKNGQQNFRACRSRFGFRPWGLTIVFDIRPSIYRKICAGGFGSAAVFQKTCMRAVNLSTMVPARKTCRDGPTSEHDTNTQQKTQLNTWKSTNKTC